MLCTGTRARASAQSQPQQQQQQQQQHEQQQQQSSDQQYVGNPFSPVQPDTFKSVTKALSNDLQAVQFLFLRVIAGKIRKSTSRHLLLREFGCHPLIRKWFISVLNLWNKVTDSRVVSDGDQQHYPATLLGVVMRENWELSQSLPSTQASALWSHQFQSFLGVMQQSLSFMSRLSPALQQLSQDLCDALHAVQSFQKVEVTQLMQCFDVWFHQKWFQVYNNPRLAPSDSVTFSTYEKWFASVPFTDLRLSQPASGRASLVNDSAGLSMACLSSLLRFRLAAHDLCVCTGRWQNRSRQQRICDRCSLQQVEDEFHMVFECPFYQDIRQYFSCLFSQFGGWRRCDLLARPETGDMRTFMRQPSHLIAAFVHKCWLRRCGQDVRVLSRSDDDHGGSISDDFVSVSSNEWFDCECELDTPMSDLLAPTGCPTAGA